jgi:hypothetical protein
LVESDVEWRKAGVLGFFFENDPHNHNTNSLFPK